MTSINETLDLEGFVDGDWKSPEPHQRVSIPHQERISDASVNASAAAFALEFPASMSKVCEALKEELGFGFSANTMRSRWMPERIQPIYEALDTPPLKNEKGLVTEFGYQAIKDFLVRTMVPKSGCDVDRMSLEDYSESVKAQYPQKTADKDDFLVTAGGFLGDEDFLTPGAMVIWEKSDISTEVERRKENARLAGTNLKASVSDYAEVFLSQFDVLGQQLGVRALERLQGNVQAVIQQGLTQGGTDLGMTKKPPTPDGLSGSSGSSQ